jgi:hypothetical protein
VRSLYFGNLHLTSRMFFANKSKVPIRFFPYSFCIVRWRWLPPQAKLWPPRILSPDASSSRGCSMLCCLLPSTAFRDRQVPPHCHPMLLSGHLDADEFERSALIVSQPQSPPLPPFPPPGVHCRCALNRCQPRA